MRRAGTLGYDAAEHESCSQDSHPNADAMLRNMMSSTLLSRSVLAFLGGALVLALLVLLAPDTAQRAHAQGKAADPIVQVPGFWDPRRRPERPDLSRITT